MDTWDENLVIICWSYVKNCIFEYKTDIFSGDPCFHCLPQSGGARTGLPMWHVSLHSSEANFCFKLLYSVYFTWLYVDAQSTSREILRVKPRSW